MKQKTKRQNVSQKTITQISNNASVFFGVLQRQSLWQQMSMAKGRQVSESVGRRQRGHGDTRRGATTSAGRASNVRSLYILQLLN